MAQPVARPVNGRATDAKPACAGWMAPAQAVQAGFVRVAGGLSRRAPRLHTARQSSRISSIPRVRVPTRPRHGTIHGMLRPVPATGHRRALDPSPACVPVRSAGRCLLRIIMRNDLDGAAPVRLAELIAALSLATDLGMGHPLEHALCSCVLAVRLGEALGLDAPALREVYYQALLRYIGCNAETHTLAAVVGDELAMRRDFAAIDNGNQGAVLNLMLRYIRQANAGAPPLQLAREVVRGLLAGPAIQASFAGHCEVAQRLGARLGFEAPIIVALGQLYERWDGRGLPRGLKGEEIAPAVLIVALAQDALTVRRLGGVDAAVGMARQRSGGAYDPRMVDCFCGQA